MYKVGRKLEISIPVINNTDKKSFSISCIKVRITSPPSFVSLEIVSINFPLLSFVIEEYGDRRRFERIFLVQSFLSRTESEILE